MTRYRRGTEPAIEAISVDALLDAETETEVPQWVHDAVQRGRLRCQRNVVEIVGGTFAASAMRNDILCFDTTQDEGNQIFYLSAVQFRRYRLVE